MDSVVSAYYNSDTSSCFSCSDSEENEIYKPNSSSLPPVNRIDYGSDSDFDILDRSENSRAIVGMQSPKTKKLRLHLNETDSSQSESEFVTVDRSNNKGSAIASSLFISQKRRYSTCDDAELGENRESSETCSTSESELTTVKKSRRPYSLNIKDASPGIKKYLTKLRRFWTKSHNLRRRALPVSTTTFGKATERILCFLGWSAVTYNEAFTPKVFEDMHRIEEYLGYLRKSRKLNPGTISNHVGSILYAVKYNHKESAPKYDNVPLVAQLRCMSTQLQVTGDRQRPRTQEDLESCGKWVPWEEFLTALRKQRICYETSVGNVETAKALMDLILLSLYTLFPPTRALEIRSLKLFIEDGHTNFSHQQEGNYLVLKTNGRILIQYYTYKTARTYGRDITMIEPDDILSTWLKDYAADWRKHLLQQDCESPYMFLNATGAEFSGPGFTRHLKRLFLTLIGKAVSVQVLRSAFVTHAFSDGNCTENLKDAIARALRHSRAQADKTYDRRTSNQKKQLALDYARQCAVGALAQGGESVPLPDTGDFVGLVEEGSTEKKPKILIGQVQYCLGTNNVHLLSFNSVPDKKNCYQLHLDGSPWVENPASLVPVVMKQTKEGGIFRLVTKLIDIHREVFKQN